MKFWLGAQPPNLPFLRGLVPPSNNVSLDLASVPAKWHVKPLNGLIRVHECDRRQTYRQTDRQTDHGMEKWVAIGEIACVRAISPKKIAKYFLKMFSLFEVLTVA